MCFYTLFPPTTRYKSDNGALIVSIVKCTDLPQAEGSQSSSDPYVKLQLLPDKQHKAKTRVLRNTHNPVYDEDFTFYGISVTHLKVRIIQLRYTIQSHFINSIHCIVSLLLLCNKLRKAGNITADTIIGSLDYVILYIEAQPNCNIPVPDTSST